MINQVIINQALCGESKGAWSLLKTTLPDKSYAEKIAFATDLQDRAGSIKWQPVIRAFPEKESFLFIKTFPDNSEDVRRGRVFSHVLIIEKKDIPLIKDIAPLFQYFTPTINKTMDLKQIHFDPNFDYDAQTDIRIKERFNLVIKYLVEFDKPIIWVGQEYYEHAICELWKLLTNSEKENILFGINFNSSEVPRNKKTFICVPESSESNFTNSSFQLIRKQDKYVLSELSEQYIANEPNAKERIENFQTQLEAKPFERSKLNKICSYIPVYENLNNERYLKKIIYLSHIIAENAEEKNKAVELKTEVLTKVCLLTEIANSYEIPVLRLFKTESYEQSQLKLSNALQKWLPNHLFSIDSNKRNDYTHLIKDFQETKNKNWWFDTFEKEFDTFISRQAIETIQIIFIWYHNLPSIFSIIGSKVSKQSEDIFIEQFIKEKDKIQSEQLKEFALSKTWLKLYAEILISEFDFEKAITEQLKVDSKGEYIEGLKIICQNTDAKRIIDYATSNKDKRLIEIAGVKCYKQPVLLEQIDIKNEIWQNVWLTALNNGLAIENSFTTINETIKELYDFISADGKVLHELIDKIGDTKYANILDNPNREALWKKLPASIVNKYLSKTATAILENVSKDASFEIPGDKRLSEFIVLNNFTKDFLHNNRNNIKSVLPVFSKFITVPEKNLEDYIRNMYDIDEISALMLGQLVIDRTFRNVANIIYSKAESYNNWRFALSKCYPLLGFFKQLWSVGKGVKDVELKKDQWWNGFEEIVVELYSYEYAISTIWTKSGGDEADIPNLKTGREIWNSLFQNMKNGKFSKKFIKNFLKAINDDYSYNTKFEVIYDNRERILND